MGINIRNNLSRLATALIKEGDKKRALEVLDKTMEVLPASRIPHNYFSLFIAEAYYGVDATEKGDEVIRGLSDLNFQELDFFTSLNPKNRNASMNEVQRNMAIYSEIIKSLNNFKRQELMEEINDKYDEAFKRLGFFEN